MSRRFILLGAALLLSARAVRADSNFGQNKLIADPFPWRIEATPHFDVYFTPDGAALVPRAKEILEDAYRKIPADLGVPMAVRTPIFLYTTHNKFEQSNVADAGEGTGGVTEAFKGRIIVYNSGADFWLEHVIPHEFTHAVQFEALYGGFWRSARLLKSPFYPLWFIEGMAEYEIGDIDRAEEDLYLRDAATRGRLYSLNQLHGFNHLKPHQVTLGYKQGAAAVRFLAEEYGRDLPGKVLRGLRDRFNEASLVSEVTGQSFAEFDRRYRAFLTDLYAAQSEGLSEPTADGDKLTAGDEIPAFNTNPALSPDGKYLAYITDRRGPREVVVRNLATGVETTAAGPANGLLEYIDTDGAGLSFSPDGRWLAFAGEKEQRDGLYLYDVKRRRIRRVRTEFEQVRAPVFHPDGTRLALVGMKEGRNDLYEVSLRGKTLGRLTDTVEDESDPAYSPDGKTLVYSVEHRGVNGNRAERDLSGLDLTSGRMRRLTNLPANETQPVFTPDGKSVIFVGEGAEEIHNLYRLDVASGRVAKLTNVIGGNFTPAFAARADFSVFVSFRDNNMDIYRAKPGLWSREGTALAAGLPEKEAPAPGPASVDLPPALPAGAPYRFKASTDLFFPLLYYSSTDGLLIASLWQASEQLGNHDLHVTFQYSSGSRALDYQASYDYKRFRPQFSLVSSGQSAFEDFEQTQLRREYENGVVTRYPLSRFLRMEGELSTLRREETFELDPARNFIEHEDAATVSLVKDIAEGRYLGVTTGHRWALSYRLARPVFGSTREYDTPSAEYHQFVPTGGEAAFAMRFRSAVSVGPSPQYYRLGGADRLRGYPREGASNQAARYVMANLEWRVPLKYIDWGGIPFLPQLAVKAIYGMLFTDVGYDWSRSSDLRHLEASQVRNSVGAGLGFPVFIFQTYPVTASFVGAKRTDASNWTWYLSLGPEF